MEFIILLIVLVVFVFLVRMFGAWMLRLDEVFNFKRTNKTIEMYI
ncbi:hypothetical protein [Flavobacterium sp. 7A]|nr:hypothetical protein [Flavobacterium sp. 7A]MCW2118474.1 hypothetical protein [Flavobacterium sp. 7A]